jgi:hypothetical protein
MTRRKRKRKGKERKRNRYCTEQEKSGATAHQESQILSSYSKDWKTNSVDPERHLVRVAPSWLHERADSEKRPRRPIIEHNVELAHPASRNGKRKSEGRSCGLEGDDCVLEGGECIGNEGEEPEEGAECDQAVEVPCGLVRHHAAMPF